jgi:tetratricopeptide (TPR) repeat protein
MQELDCREIRVFISSTLVDFMEERDLLVKQVFPSLRRRAQERGVELVDVDLRWGITEEESQQGKVIGICLAEIERCRPYFIGMLGDRYGWTPQRADYPPELLEQEQLQWIKDHQGEASVTELEILHGVLNDKQMAGRAFFYFRDPSWSQTKSEPGFVCDSPAEQARLDDLKTRIRASGFPVAENLARPQAIANRIEADLWAQIEEQYPDLDQADALEREARMHASYRQSRTGVYLGGEGYIRELESWVQCGEQKILITGESGFGKSALIANWMAAHQQSTPADVVFAHHLGCSNDSSAIRPLLGRMLDTSSRLLVEHELISDAIKVPDDWWELTAKVAETLQDLGRWCRNTNNRWIWVLDGLDRLNQDDQQALPWLPLLLPEGVSVLISALDCQGRSILQARKFRTLEIGLLQRPAQEALIDRYLGRYIKKLQADRREQILNCPMAASPLFLRVLLEELRQCGRFETLKKQIAQYTRPNADGSLAVDDLYCRLLERLENDGNEDNVRKAMTALWASRAGLTEPELLAITGLRPLEWSPIDLALGEAFGRNGNRLMFDHDFLRIAVRDRYLSNEKEKQQAHSDLADWYESREGWDERDSEELPWQLMQAGKLEDLRQWLLLPEILANLQWHRGSREVINYWRMSRAEEDDELDEVIAEAVQEEIEKLKEYPENLIWFVNCMANLLDEAGMMRELLLWLRTLSLELEETADDKSEEAILTSLSWLASAHRKMGYYDKAEDLYRRCHETRKRLLGPDNPQTLGTLGEQGLLYHEKGDYKQAETYYRLCLESYERRLGLEHPDALVTVGNLGNLLKDKGDYEQAEALQKWGLEVSERLLGAEHPQTLSTVANLANLYRARGNFKLAEECISRCLEASERLLGPEHPATLVVVGNLGSLYRTKGEYGRAKDCYMRCLEATERLLGPMHPTTLITVGNLGNVLAEEGDYDKAEECYLRCLEGGERLLGQEHPSNLTALSDLSFLYFEKGMYEQAEVFAERCLEARQRVLGPDHPDTISIIVHLAGLLQYKGNIEKAENYFNHCLEARQRMLGPEHPDTLTTIGHLASLFHDSGDIEQAETLNRRCLEASERLLGPEHPITLATVSELANLLSDQERFAESIPLRRQELAVANKRDGCQATGTLTSIHRLAEDLCWANELEESEQLYREALSGRIAALGSDAADTMASRYSLAHCLSKQERYGESIALRRVELAWCRQHNGDTDPGTLSSINGLAIDLRENGDLEEAEDLFRELVAGLQRELEPKDFQIGQALGDLAMTLEEACKLEEALNYAQQCLDHSFECNGADSWYTNRERLHLARVLHKLGRHPDAVEHLITLHDSLTNKPNPNGDDNQLLAVAAALLDLIGGVA